MIDLQQLSFKNVFDLKGAEDVFEQLVEIVKVQNSEIESLKSQHEKETNKRSIVQLEKKVWELQQDLSHVRSNETILKQTIQNQQLQITELKNQLNNKIDQTKAERSFVQLTTQFESQVRELQNDTTHTTRFQQIERNESHIHEKLNALEKMVHCKVDQVDFNTMEVSSRKMTTFISMSKNMMEDLHTQVTEMKETMDLHSTVAMENTVQFTTFKEKTEKQLHDMTEKSKKRFATIGSKVTALSAQQLTWSTNLLQALQENHHTIQDKWTNELKQRVLTNDLEQVQAQVAMELNCKAWKKDVQSNHIQVLKLKEQYNELQKQVTLAIRFVNWFSDRGEAYEHNFKMIEKQMGQFDMDKENARISTT